MSGLPKSWAEAPIRALMKSLPDGKLVHQGWSPQCESGPARSNSDWGALKTTAIQDGAYLPEHNKRLPDSLEAKERLEVQPGDLLMTCAGPRVRCGVACLVRETPAKRFISGKMYRFRANEQLIEPRLLEAFLRTPETKRQIDAMKTGISESGMNITHERFSQLDVPVAPRPEQKRIADKLDSVLTRVDAVNTRLARVAPILKRFRQSILAAATSGRLTQDWRPMTDLPPMTEQVLTATRLRAGCSMKDARITGELIERGYHLSPNELIPTTWICTCIGMVGIVSNGSTPSRSEPSYWGGSIPWVSSGEVRNNRIGVTKERISQLGFTSSSVKLLPAGSVLIAMIGEGKTRGQSGLLDIAATINQNIAAVVPNEALIEPEYLWYWFQSQYEANRVAGNGTGPQALNCQKVRELNLNLPPLQEQREIVRRVETLFAFADRLEARLQTAQTVTERLTPALLAKAFRGELVPQDPNDEPASELIKRLAAQVPAGPSKGRRAKASASAAC